MPAEAVRRVPVSRPSAYVIVIAALLLAAGARPGDEIGLWRAHARVLDAEPERYLLAGDHTALPAIAFILDHLPADAEGDVLISVPAPSEQQPLRQLLGMSVKWLFGNRPVGEAGDGASDALGTAVRALGREKVARSFVWAGAEASVARDIRTFVRKKCSLPAGRTYILNYWKRGAVEGTYDHGE